MVLVVAAPEDDELVLSAWHDAREIGELAVEVGGAHYVDLFPLVDVFVVHLNQDFAHFLVEQMRLDAAELEDVPVSVAMCTMVGGSAG